MCIGVPMQLLSGTEGRALCEGRGRREALDMMLVGDQPAGTWLLAHQRTAVRVLTADEARQTNDALDALEAALVGDGGIAAHFADLVAREPQLPEHLRGNAR
jgi:hydrogenase expression/formation protein HypC